MIFNQNNILQKYNLNTVVSYNKKEIRNWIIFSIFLNILIYIYILFKSLLITFILLLGMIFVLNKSYVNKYYYRIFLDKDKLIIFNNILFNIENEIENKNLLEFIILDLKRYFNF